MAGVLIPCVNYSEKYRGIRFSQVALIVRFPRHAETRNNITVIETRILYFHYTASYDGVLSGFGNYIGRFDFPFGGFRNWDMECNPSFTCPTHFKESELHEGAEIPPMPVISH